MALLDTGSPPRCLGPELHDDGARAELGYSGEVDKGGSVLAFGGAPILMLFCLFALLPSACAPRQGVRSSSARSLCVPIELQEGLVAGIAGGWPRLGQLVDPARGLVHGVWPRGDREDLPPPTVAHLCGSDLAAELPRLQERLGDNIRAALQDENIHCNETALECTFSVRQEFAPTYHLQFERREDGTLALAAVFELDEIAGIEDYLARQREFAEQALARRRPCASSS